MSRTKNSVVFTAEKKIPFLVPALLMSSQHPLPLSKDPTFIILLTQVPSLKQKLKIGLVNTPLIEGPFCS